MNRMRYPAVAFGLLSGGCGGGEPPPPKPPDVSVSAPWSSSSAMCDVLDHPCTVSDVAPDRWRLSQVLLERAATERRSGRPLEAIAEGLRDVPEVVSARVIDGGLFLRVASAPPVYLIEPTLIDMTSATAATGPKASSKGGRPRKAKSMPMSLPRGSGCPPDTREARRGRRRALVINALRGAEEAPLGAAAAHQVRIALNGRREYRGSGGVCLRSGDDAGLDAFRGWSAWDHVFLVAHGAQHEVNICETSAASMARCAALAGTSVAACKADPASCISRVRAKNPTVPEDYPVVQLTTAHPIRSCDQKEVISILDGLGVSDRMVTCGRSATGRSDELYLMVNDKYLRGSAPKAGVVMLLACESMKRTWLADALAPERNAVFGWSEITTLGKGRRAYRALMDEMLVRGGAASDALLQVRGRIRAFEVGAEKIPTELLHYGHPGRHLRETIAFDEAKESFELAPEQRMVGAVRELDVPLFAEDVDVKRRHEYVVDLFVGAATKPTWTGNVGDHGRLLSSRSVSATGKQLGTYRIPAEEVDLELPADMSMKGLTLRVTMKRPFDRVTEHEVSLVERSVGPCPCRWSGNGRMAIAGQPAIEGSGGGDDVDVSIRDNKEGKKSFSVVLRSRGNGQANAAVNDFIGSGTYTAGRFDAIYPATPVSVGLSGASVGDSGPYRVSVNVQLDADGCARGSFTGSIATAEGSTQVQADFQGPVGRSCRSQ
ncbi:MAG: hypothetical protein AAF715_12520 [Myxococcota bacterium]